MATLDKEIKIIAVTGAKGDNGKSSYELAVEELHYSGTLEEWIETFATPENYVTRNEFQKVTQAEYDALVEAGELIPNCYYIITDDTSYTDLVDRIDNMAGDVEDVIEEFEASMETRMEAVEEAVRTGLRLNLTSIECACNFAYWNNNSMVASDGSDIPAISLKVSSTYGNNQVNILPTDCITSVAEARVEYVSGDNNYIEFYLDTISSNQNYITFTAKNISGDYIRSYGNTGNYTRTTTFKIYIKDVYNNEFEKEFTINFKTNV